MTIPELGDAVKAAFKAGAFQTDAYAPFSRNPTFRVGDMTLSTDSGIVTLRDGSRFDLTKSAILPVDGVEYPLLHAIRRDGSTQDNWTNMEDGRTLFQDGIGKWNSPEAAALSPANSKFSQATIAARPVPFPDFAQRTQRLTTDKYFGNYASPFDREPDVPHGLARFESPRTGASAPVPYLGPTRTVQRLLASASPSDVPAFPSWPSPAVGGPAWVGQRPADA